MTNALDTITVLPITAEAGSGLVTIPPASVESFFVKADQLDPILARIEEEVRGFVPDTATAKGRDAIRSLAFKVTRTKTGLDALGKALVDEMKEKPKLVDASRKRMRDRLEALAEEVRKPLTEWEAEQARIEAEKKAKEDAVRLRVQEMSQIAARLVAASSTEVAAELHRLESLTIGTDWAPFESEAATVHASAIGSLRDLYTAATRREEEAAELQRLRDAEAARKAEEEKERLRKEGEERAKREAEEAAQRERESAARREAEAKAAAERAEREKAEAEARAKEAEARAEQAKKDAEAQAEAARVQAIEDERRRVEAQRLKEEAEQKAREADREHRAGINREVLADLVANVTGISEEQAKAIVVALASGKIRHASLKY